MSKPVKILVFAAGNSRNSINKMLAIHASDILKSHILPEAQITVLDLNDYEMKIYSVERENQNGIPDEAKAFYKAIGDADALLISYPEHNGLYTAAFKNIFDWCSRINMKVFQDKPMVIMATSPGPNGGANVLKTANESAGFFGANIKGAFAVPSFHKTFDTEKGCLLDANLKKELHTQLAKLA
jgi:NAD(P)H-dependent FMN reductase